MNITQPFTVTTQQIQNEVAKMSTKAEILAYLTAVKDYVGTTMKLTRAYMKGMK